MPNKHAPEMHKFLCSNNLILVVPDGYQGSADTASSDIAVLGKIIKNSALFTIITALFLLPALPLSAEDDFTKAVRQLAEAGDREAQFSLPPSLPFSLKTPQS